MGPDRPHSSTLAPGPGMLLDACYQASELLAPLSHDPQQVGPDIRSRLDLLCNPAVHGAIIVAQRAGKIPLPLRAEEGGSNGEDQFSGRHLRADPFAASPDDLLYVWDIRHFAQHCKPNAQTSEPLPVHRVQRLPSPPRLLYPRPVSRHSPVRGHDPEDHANCCGGVSRGRVPPDRLRIRTRGARDPRGQ